MSNSPGKAFEVTIEGFKQKVAEFRKAAPSADQESLAAGFKCLSLAYLNMKSEHPSDLIVAASYLKFATKTYTECTFNHTATCA